MSNSETNGNIIGDRRGTLHNTLAPASSTEDLSEYTDADESISAPTEFLAEVSLINITERMVPSIWETQNLGGVGIAL